MAIAFFLPVLLPFPWFRPITPYLDQIITVTLSIFMLPTPIKTVITGLPGSVPDPAGGRDC